MFYKHPVIMWCFRIFVMKPLCFLTLGHRWVIERSKHTPAWSLQDEDALSLSIQKALTPAGAHCGWCHKQYNGPYTF